MSPFFGTYEELDDTAKQTAFKAWSNRVATYMTEDDAMYAFFQSVRDIIFDRQGNISRIK